MQIQGAELDGFRESTTSLGEQQRGGCFALSGRELGLSRAALARRLRLSPAGISLSVKRGEEIVRKLGRAQLEASGEL